MPAHTHTTHKNPIPTHSLTLRKIYTQVNNFNVVYSYRWMTRQFW